MPNVRVRAEILRERGGQHQALSTFVEKLQHLRVLGAPAIEQYFEPAQLLELGRLHVNPFQRVVEIADCVTRERLAPCQSILKFLVSGYLRAFLGYQAPKCVPTLVPLYFL